MRPRPRRCEAEAEAPAAPEPAERPAEPAPPPAAAPIGAADLPLAGLAGDRRAAGRHPRLPGAAPPPGRAREPDARLLPFRLPAPPAVDPATGLAAQPLAPQAAQRRRGVEADPRHAVATLVLEALARAGWPDAQVVSLCDGAERLTFRLRLGAPPPADLDPLLEALEEDHRRDDRGRRPGERGELALTLRDLSPEQAWRAGFRLPSAPLATVGLAGDGLLSVALDALDGGLLIAGARRGAGAGAGAAQPGRALPAGRPAGGAAGRRAAGRRPGRPAAPAAAAGRPVRPGGQRHRSASLREELRARQAAAGDAAGELIVLVVDEPAAVDGPALRELVRDGAEVGIYALLATATPASLDGALLAACPGRLVTRLDGRRGGVRLAGRAGRGGARARRGLVAAGGRAGPAGAPAAHGPGRPPGAPGRHGRGGSRGGDGATDRHRPMTEEAAPEPSEREPVGPAACCRRAMTMSHHNGHDGHNGNGTAADELAALAPLAVAPAHDGRTRGNGHQPTLPMAVTPPTRPAPDAVTARTGTWCAAGRWRRCASLKPASARSDRPAIRHGGRSGIGPGQTRVHGPAGAERGGAAGDEAEEESRARPSRRRPRPTARGPACSSCACSGRRACVDGRGAPVNLGRGLV